MEPQKLPLERAYWDTFAGTHYADGPGYGPRIPGQLPVIDVGEESVLLRPSSRSDVFHFSRRTPQQFMRAPFLHVGSGEQASVIDDHSWYHSVETGPYTRGPLYPHENPRIHRFTFSPDVKFHHETVSDEIANIAHAQVAQERNLKVSRDVIGIYSGDPIQTVIKHKVNQVANSLRAGLVIPYSNVHEMEGAEAWPEGSDLNPMSYVVPNPRVNLIRDKKWTKKVDDGR